MLASNRNFLAFFCIKSTTDYRYDHQDVTSSIQEAYMANILQLNQFTSIAEILAHSTRLYPQAAAFSDADSTITYSELDQLSTAPAQYLSQELGMSPGDRIAIQLNNIVQYPIAIYAALKARLIVVNTNPLYTSREIIYQFNDAGVKALIVLEELLPLHESIASETLLEHIITVTKGTPSDKKPTQPGQFNDCLYRGARFSASFPPCQRDDIAFLQYTGGTTGVSKGAMLTHNNVLSNIRQTLEAIGHQLVPQEEIMVVPLPMYHAYACAISALIMPFWGAQSILISNPKDLNAFATQLEGVSFSIFAGINTLFVGLSQHQGFQSLDFSRLKLTLSGGTALTRAAMQSWVDLTGCPVCELVNGIKQVRKILASDALTPWRSEELHPGTQAQTDEQILEKCKERLGLVYHPVGTCKMGVDDMAVVDSQLRVKGVEALRIVDASVMPTLISGNTNAPTIMIAERAADLILGETTMTRAEPSKSLEPAFLSE